MLDKTQVHEVVLAGALELPLHHAEQQVGKLARQLPASQDQPVLPCALPPLSVFAEVQFSDNNILTNLDHLDQFLPPQGAVFQQQGAQNQVHTIPLLCHQGRNHLLQVFHNCVKLSNI